MPPDEQQIAETVEAQKQRIGAAIELIDAALKTEESLDRKSDNVWRFLDAANERLYEAMRLIDGGGADG